MAYQVYEDNARLLRYQKNKELFEAEHYKAFDIKKSELMQDPNNKIHYLVANFTGMLSRLAADSLFGFEEYPRISFTDEPKTKWLSDLEFANSLSIQLYESALENSYRGDAILRIRSESGKLIVEDLNPATWFPIYDQGNTRREPTAHILQWKSSSDKFLDKDGKPQEIVIQEKHTKGKVETVGMVVVGEEITEIPTEKMVEMGYSSLVETKVTDWLIFHIPNSRTNDSLFGIDDYRDVKGLVEAVNNRLTRIDNVLDKHGDPILTVPAGVLDVDGKVSKSSFGLIEVPDGEGASKPEYIVWDAKLEATFMMIDHLMEVIYMVSETSPAAFGLDKNGVAESGRALKYKMLRTLAKKHRKQAYYDVAIKRMLYVAQQFAKANNLTVNGTKFTGEPEIPTIEWQDGIINDAVEIMDIEERKINAGLASRVDVLQRMEGMTQEQAEERVKAAKEEAAANAPTFNANPMATLPPEPKA